MKPLRILLFFISVFLILFAITLYFPHNGIELTKDLRLHFFTASDIFKEDTVRYADISGIIDQNKLLNETQTALKRASHRLSFTKMTEPYCITYLML